MQVTRAALVIVFVLSLALLLQLFLVSGQQQRSAQKRAFDELRANLAAGTAPIGPTDADGDPLAPGTPVAYIEIPELGLTQVIGEGTSPSVLFDGPGHRVDTPLPGQAGTSVVLGRQSAYGGPFAHIEDLVEGNLIRVTTGQGTFTFTVIGVRREGDPVPEPLAPGDGRLVLTTAAGGRFLPTGVLRVDANLDGDAVGGAPRVVSTDTLPSADKPMGIDTGTMWVLLLWLQALIALSVIAVWSWHRWGHARTWVVLLPPLLFVGLAACGEAARLLPNLT